MNRYDAQLQRLLKIAMYFDYAKTLSKSKIRTLFYPEASQESADRAFVRDRELLKLSGIELTYDEHTFSYSYTADAMTTRPLVLTQEERVALGVALRTIESEPTFPLPLALETGIAKIAKRLHDDTDEFLMGARMTLDENTSEQQGMLEVLIGAIKETVKVTFDYTNARGERSQRTIAPFGLDLFKGQWYLFGLDEENARTIRTFTVANIENLALTKEPFELPSHFSIKDCSTPPFLWGDAEIKSTQVLIPANSAHRVSFITSDAGTCTEQDDGSIIWDVSYRNIDELCSLVIGEGLTFVDAKSEENSYLVHEFLGRVVSAHA